MYEASIIWWLSVHVLVVHGILFLIKAEKHMLRYLHVTAKDCFKLGHLDQPILYIYQP